MSEVLTRHKEIMYSSRTRQNTDAFARLHNMKMRLAEALRRVPPEGLRPGEKEFIATCSNGATINIVHLIIIYQHKNYEGHARDYEFSGTSMREHWDSGYEDTLRTLRHPEWLERSAIASGVTVHDLHREDPT
jgi:NTE family protein